MLSSIKEIGLAHNRLRGLPESMGDLRRLQTVVLPNNQFEQFPDFLTRLAYIREINLDSNSLTTLPESIGALENLGVLSLNSNELTSLPGSVTNVGEKAGLFLFVHDNRLCSLPDSIQTWLDRATQATTWDWRTTQRCPQSAVTPPAVAPAPNRALSVVSQGPGNPDRIEYRVSTPGPVRIQVWNAAGMLVGEPVNSLHAPGRYVVSLAGTRLARGTYMIRMVSDSRQILRPVVVGP